MANALEFFARVFGIDRRDSYWFLAHHEPSRWHGVEAKGDACDASSPNRLIRARVNGVMENCRHKRHQGWFGSAMTEMSLLLGTRKRVRKCKGYVCRRNVVSLFGMITKVVYSYVHKLP